MNIARTYTFGDVWGVTHAIDDRDFEKIFERFDAAEDLARQILINSGEDPDDAIRRPDVILSRIEPGTNEYMAAEVMHICAQARIAREGFERNLSGIKSAEFSGLVSAEYRIRMFGLHLMDRCYQLGMRQAILEAAGAGMLEMAQRGKKDIEDRLEGARLGNATKRDRMERRRQLVLRLAGEILINAKANGDKRAWSNARLMRSIVRNWPTNEDVTEPSDTTLREDIDILIKARKIILPVDGC